MKIEDILQKLMESKQAIIEWPAMCGHSDSGKNKGACSHHGHLAIAVTKETAQGVINGSFGGNGSVMMLITYPRKLHDEIFNEIKPEQKSDG